MKKYLFLLTICLININASLNLKNTKNIAFLLNKKSLINNQINQNLLRNYSKKTKRINLNKARILKNKQLLNYLIENQKILTEIQKNNIKDFNIRVFREFNSDIRGSEFKSEIKYAFATVFASVFIIFLLS